MKFLLNDFIVRDYVKEALKEDIGYGDISTDYVCAHLKGDEIFEVNLRTRQDGIFCGREVFEIVFFTIESFIFVFYQESAHLSTFGAVIADKIKMTMDPKDFVAEGNVRTIIHNIDTKEEDL